ncbi:MAG: hypothetical protein ACE5H1_04805, partial [Thermodesulfobacteriota bacterium]
MSLLRKETNLSSLLASMLTYSLILCLSGCGGEGGDGFETVLDVKATTTTVGGIEFAHNGFYSEDELTDALLVIDEYLELNLSCAKAEYPDLVDVIDVLPMNELLVVIMFPDFFDPESGREAFKCKSSVTGKCSGAYNIGTSTILITPSLDALGHEMSHWINEMLFGSTSHDDPNDLTNLCPISPMCHLYSEIRNL